ncbi:RNA methyltransferase [soil metagenome]
MNGDSGLMRRRSAGVIKGHEALPARLAAVASIDAERIIRVLEPYVTDRRRERLHEVIGRRVGCVSVLFDAPHDPHNGAAVLRTCEAFGVQHLHVVERRETFLSAASVSRGAEKWVDIHTYPTVAPALAALEGTTLVAADADGELIPSDLAEIPRLCVILGNERDGITGELVAACTKRVRVPMRGFIDSLNVSVTAAILLSHAVEGRPGDLSDQEKRRLYARGLYFSVQRAADILG